MNIIQVSYRRLRTFGNYENETVEAAATVPEGTPPEEVLEELRGWVNEEIAGHSAVRLLAAETERARQELYELNREVDAAKTRVEAARRFLEQHGLPSLPGFGADEIPF